MQHEKRSTIRKNVSYDILVNHDFIDPRRWRTRDLCMDSVFVKMRAEAKLPGAWVEVVLLSSPFCPASEWLIFWKSRKANTNRNKTPTAAIAARDFNPPKGP